MENTNTPTKLTRKGLNEKELIQYVNHLNGKGGPSSNETTTTSEEKKKKAEQSGKPWLEYLDKTLNKYPNAEQLLNVLKQRVNNAVEAGDLGLLNKTVGEINTVVDKLKQQLQPQQKEKSKVEQKPPPQQTGKPKVEQKPLSNPEEQLRAYSLLKEQTEKLLPQFASLQAFDEFRTFQQGLKEIDGQQDVGRKLEQMTTLSNQAKQLVSQLEGDKKEFLEKRDKTMELIETVDRLLPSKKEEFRNRYDSNTLGTKYSAQLVQLRQLHAELEKLVPQLKLAHEEYSKLENETKSLVEKLPKASIPDTRDYKGRFHKIQFARGVDVTTHLQELKEFHKEVLLFTKEGPQKFKEATQLITSKKEEVLKSLSSSQKIDLMINLGRGDENSAKERRSARNKLYKAMGLEQDFLKHDNEKRQEIVSQLSKNQTLKNARANWKNVNPKEKVKHLNLALEIQRKVLGLDKVPEVTVFSEAPKETIEGYKTCQGFYSDGEQKIYLNDGGENLNDFDELLDTVIHENTHYYQHRLVDLLKEGKLKESDPRYNQAKIFALNFDDQVAPKEDQTTYERQPIENHAWTAGRQAKGIFKPTPPPVPKNNSKN